MRLRVRCSTGVSNLEIDPSTTFGALKKQLNASKLQKGYPPRLLDSDDTQPISALLSNGDMILVQSAPSTQASTPSTQAPTPVRQATSSPLPTIPTSSILSQGTLLTRVVPDDNSCMFRSVNGIIGQPHESVTPLRLIVSHAIRDEPMLYSEAFLGRPNADYQTWILSENAWGGAIDLPILSHHFKLELAAFDVKTMRLDRYGENKSYLNIGYLIYDGIHYNYVALALGGVANLDADITQFDANDSLVYHHVRALAQKEHDAHNYTDTASFSLKCGQCGMKLKGETQAVQHAKATGHSQFDENK